jgi:hypothetical protein
MKTIMGILVIVGLLAGAASTALAADSAASTPQVNVLAKSPEGQGPASHGSGFASEGFARDVMNLVTGLSHPLDDSTSLTIRAGKSLHIGLSF